MISRTLSHYVITGKLGGADRLRELAAVNARLGNDETAIEQYRTLIEFTGAYSVPVLEIDFYMDTVRDHPRYKELVQQDSAS